MTDLAGFATATGALLVLGAFALHGWLEFARWRRRAHRMELVVNRLIRAHWSGERDWREAQGAAERLLGGEEAA